MKSSSNLCAGRSRAGRPPNSPQSIIGVYGSLCFGQRHLESVKALPPSFSIRFAAMLEQFWKIYLTNRLVERLRNDEKTACWIWTGSTNGGYGRIVIGSRSDGTRHAVSVHRLAYELFIGRVPNGMQLDHVCRNRSCCNPFHLDPVTAKENIRRSPIHNGSKTHCKRGHLFTKENTILFPNRKWRKCRACKNERQYRTYHGLR